MNYSENVKLDFIKRTLDILNDESIKCKYDVTHMLNLSLGLIIIPNEKKGDYICKKFNNIDVSKFTTNIKIESGQDITNAKHIHMIRNGLAHGDINMSSDPTGKYIEAIKIRGDTDCHKTAVSYEFKVDKFRLFATAIAETYIKETIKPRT